MPHETWSRKARYDGREALIHSPRGVRFERCRVHVPSPGGLPHVVRQVHRRACTSLVGSFAAGVRELALERMTGLHPGVLSATFRCAAPARCGDGGGRSKALMPRAVCTLSPVTEVPAGRSSALINYPIRWRMGSDGLRIRRWTITR
jgi:hypothetical protein